MQKTFFTKDTNIIIMTNIKDEQIALQMLKDKGYNVVVADKEADFAGTDCYVIYKGRRYNIDLKGLSTLQEYKNTVLVSLGFWSNYQECMQKPKYLTHNNIWVVICDTVGKQDIFILSPDMLKEIENKDKEGRVKILNKMPEHDYFHRSHRLAVVKKADCLRQF